MKSNISWSWERAALYIFFGLLAYIPMHIFLSTWIGTSFGILETAKGAKDVVLVGGFLIAVLASIRKPWFETFYKSIFIWFIVAYAALTVLLALVRPTDQDAEILGVVYNLRYLVFFLYALLLGHLFKPRHLLRRAVQIVLVMGAAVVLFGIVQYVFLPDTALRHVGYKRSNGVLPAFFIDNKPDLERIMSTLRDPNSLGSYLIIIAPLAAAAFFLVRDQRKKLLCAGLLVATTLTTWLTFSRSAWIGFAVTMALFVLLSDHPFKEAVRKQGRIILPVTAACLVVLGSGLVIFRDSYVVQNVIFHADESTVLEDPNELRVKFWQESLADIAADPLGGGPGIAGLASIKNSVQGVQLNENYYLQIASEVGLLGIGMFIVILITIAFRLSDLHVGDPVVTALLASFAGLAVTNFLNHIWSSEAVAFTWWGLAGLALALGPHGTRSLTRKKSSKSS